VSALKIAPSILSADFTRLGEQIREAEEGGAEWIHVDVMDGHFVPNITIGPLVAAAARRATKLPIDVHLMIEHPERYVDAFADAGADYITVHVEAGPHLHRTVQQIRARGAHPGVTLNPATPVEAISEILPYVDLVLVMSVNPGFGGQSYIPTSTARIARIRRMLGDAGLDHVELEVDGGVSAQTIAQVAGAGATVVVAGSGATVVVAGSAVYNREAPPAENIARLRAALGA
jgi:ribulose-phosphate 3-epimerase